MAGGGGRGDADAGGGGGGCGGADESDDEGVGTEGEGTDGSGVGSWLAGGDWGPEGWVSVTVIVVPGTVTMEPGTVTVVPGIVTVLPGTVTVVPGIVTTEPGRVTVTVSVTVQPVLPPPFMLTDADPRPGLDGKTVVCWSWPWLPDGVGRSREEGKDAVSVTVTGGGQP